MSLHWDSYADEELALRPNVYEDGLFLPIYIGDVYRGRYIVVEKLGYGSQFIRAHIR